jgi:hypothetical protein
MDQLGHLATRLSLYSGSVDSGATTLAQLLPPVLLAASLALLIAGFTRIHRHV